MIFDKKENTTPPSEVHLLPCLEMQNVGKARVKDYFYNNI